MQTSQKRQGRPAITQRLIIIDNRCALRSLLVPHPPTPAWDHWASITSPRRPMLHPLATISISFTSSSILTTCPPAHLLARTRTHSRAPCPWRMARQIHQQPTSTRRQEAQQRVRHHSRRPIRQCMLATSIPATRQWPRPRTWLKIRRRRLRETPAKERACYRQSTPILDTSRTPLVYARL